MDKSRRNFIKNASILTVGGILLPFRNFASYSDASEMKTVLDAYDFLKPYGTPERVRINKRNMFAQGINELGEPGALQFVLFPVERETRKDRIPVNGFYIIERCGAKEECWYVNPGDQYAKQIEFDNYTNGISSVKEQKSRIITEGWNGEADRTVKILGERYYCPFVPIEQHEELRDEVYPDKLDSYLVKAGPEYTRIISEIPFGHAIIEGEIYRGKLVA